MMRIVLTLATWLFVSGALAGTLDGRVVGVVDGDTIDVLVDGHEKHRIRVSGIDAPEKRQPFGQAAKHRMSDLVMGRDAQIEYSKRDRYGRIIGVVLVGGEDAGLALIRSGLAWHYIKYTPEQSDGDRVAYANAEAIAKQDKVGLWGDAHPIAPWDWRSKPR